MKNPLIFRRSAAALLALLLLISCLPKVTADTASEPFHCLTLEEMQEKFPEGKYWNGGDPDSWTETPCNHHGNCPNGGGCGCNSFMGLSIQCMGFAEKLGYDATGFSPRKNANGWSTSYSVSALNSLKPGDIVRRNGHSMYVIGVDGDVVTIADCNSKNRSCNIRWGGVLTKSNLTYNFEHVRSAPTELVTGYNDLCLRYPSFGTVTVTADTVLYSSPCTTQVLESSTAVTTAPAGSQWKVIKLYLNTVDEYWYRTELAGTACYLPASSCQFTGEAGKISISNVVAPVNTRYGYGFSIGGKITADTLALTKVGAYVYQGDSITDTPYKVSEDLLDGKQTYSISGSTVDDNLPFGKLPVGNYTYVIKAWVENHHADGNTLTAEDTEYLLYQSTFTVSQSLACSHSYQLAAGSEGSNGLMTYVCSKCGYRYTVTVYATDYFKLCEAYLSHGTVTVSADTTLYSLPCTQALRTDASAVTAAAAGSQWNVTGLYKNTLGQYWYKTAYQGTACYLYAGDGEFTADNGNVTVSGVSAPTHKIYTYSFPIKGKISSDTLPLTRVGAYLYKGDGIADTAFLPSEVSLTNIYTYELYNSTVDSNMTFGSVPIGSYTYAIKAWVQNNHANSNTLTALETEILLYQSTFTVSQTVSCTHSYGTPETVNSTCVATGLTTYRCTKCDYSYTVTVLTPGEHTFGPWQTLSEPTCTQTGEAMQVCTGCGLTRYQALDMTEHTEQATVIAPTCTEQGYTILTCANCGQELSKEDFTDALGHSAVIDAALAATCTATGLTEGKHCDRCGQILTAQEVTDALGHSYGQPQITVAPTYTGEGRQQSICDRCGDTVTQTVPPLENPVKQWNVTLRDNIGVNFAVTLAETDEITVTVNGQPVDYSLSDGMLSVQVAAAQMGDTIAVAVNGQPLVHTYSVYEYAQAILAGEYSEATKELVRAMLTYGGAAQSYFDYETQSLVSDGIPQTAPVPTGEPTLKVTGKLEEVLYYGATLVHEDKIAVRIYFSGNLEGVTFTAEGKPAASTAKGDMAYVEVGGILPQDLGKPVTVTAEKDGSTLSVSYSPLDYILRIYGKQDTPELAKALAQALYGYYLAAKNYTETP